MPATRGETRYAQAADGAYIAYQVTGSGPIDLVLIPGFISHLEARWDEPELSRMFDRLGTFARVIAFDKRGTGLSDRTDTLPDLDQRMEDVTAVMDAVGSSQAALFGMSEGGPMALLFAATHPDRTRALVLWGTYARMLRSDDYAPGIESEALQRFVDHLEPRWGTGTGLSAWAPSQGADPDARERWASVQRLAATPSAARALMTAYADVDVRPVLPTVRAPSLVLHRTGDRMIPLEAARYLAEHLPDARLVELPGEDHFIWTQDPDRIVEEIEEFLTGTRTLPEADRVLATVLFTDIVGSTERAASVGDHEWRRTLDRHDALVVREVEAGRGRVVKTTGDGALATFDGPARAVRAAQAIGRGAVGLGIDVRCGLHIGEVELRDDDIAGIAVHVAQRIEAEAEPGEVLVSRTLVDLVAGSGLSFSPRGEHELKGVPGAWSVFAVD